MSSTFDTIQCVMTMLCLVVKLLQLGVDKIKFANCQIKDIPARSYISVLGRVSPIVHAVVAVEGVVSADLVHAVGGVGAVDRRDEVPHLPDAGHRQLDN